MIIQKKINFREIECSKNDILLNQNNIFPEMEISTICKEENNESILSFYTN